MVGFLGDFDRAEEAVQEAFAIAVERWPRDGMPDNPAGWLVVTARNRAIDRLRRERTVAAGTKLLEVAETMEDEIPETSFPDERLELIFTCAHPALNLDAQVALTLWALGGLRTGEIARAFLVSETTMAQRLVRAKRKIRTRGSRSVSRRTIWLPDRLAGVLAVVYLIFNEGYDGRADLTAEAIRLGLALTELMPDEPEVHGLLALMLFNDSRRDARAGARARSCCWPIRTGRSGTGAGIEAGLAALARARALAGSGAYVLQAEIASLHAADETDWRQIASMYGELLRVTRSPVVELNRAVAIGEAEGPSAGLAAIEGLQLDGYLYFHTTRADFLRRLDRRDEARECRI